MEGVKAYPDTLDIILQATQFYLDANNTDQEPSKLFTRPWEGSGELHSCIW